MINNLVPSSKLGKLTILLKEYAHPGVFGGLSACVGVEEQTLLQPTALELLLSWQIKKKQ